MRVLLAGGRGLARSAQAGMVAGPIFALVLAAFLDRGPDGSALVTPIYVALALWEPLVRDCVFNSLAVALAVTAGSLVLGVALARSATRWQFWGRDGLVALAAGPLVVPPLIGAIGLGRLLERTGLSGLAPREPGSWGGWLALVWLGLALGVPWVGLRAGAALARVEPAWEAAARALGARGWRAWWRVTWPVIRPEAARAAAEVFTLTLIEPGAPWVLGVRRTLAFQIVQAALDPGALPRAAALALLGLVLATLGRAALRAWGRPPLSWPAGPGARPRRADWPRASALVGPGLVWLAVAWAPAAGVLGAALAGGGRGEPRRSATEAGASSWALMGGRQVLVNSVVLGLAVGGLDLLIALGLASGRPETSAAAGQRGRGEWSWGVPPLALGVGLLAIPWDLGMVSNALGGDGPLARALRGLGDGLDAYRSPGLLLAWAVAATHLPILARACGEAIGRARPVLAEAAVTLGASRRRAGLLAFGRPLAVSLGAALLLTASLAATESATSLVLAPTSEARTIGPALAIAAADPEGERFAVELASGALLLNLSALAVAIRAGAVGGRGGLRRERDPQFE